MHSIVQDKTTIGRKLVGELGVPSMIFVYCGNSVRYMLCNKAIVNPMFKSQEMQDILNCQKDILEVNGWTVLSLKHREINQF